MAFPCLASKAAQFGLVNQVVAKGEALNGALQLAERIVANAPLAVREAKACVDEMTQQGMDDSAAFERSKRAMAFLARTDDFFEGPRAFIEESNNSAFSCL